MGGYIITISQVQCQFNRDLGIVLHLNLRVTAVHLMCSLKGIVDKYLKSSYAHIPRPASHGN